MSSSSKKIIKVLLPLVIIGLAFAIVKILQTNKPEARRFGGRTIQPMLVETKELSLRRYQPMIPSQGVVTAHTRTKLSAQVSGKIAHLDEKLRRGAHFSKGDVLLKLESTDYEIEVQIAQADVANAESALQQELAQAEVAERDWNLRPKDKQARALVLREPQVKAAKAALKAAQARLNRAKLNLERTVIRAPYSGRVLERHVDYGQVINANTQIAEIFSSEKLEVRLPIKNKDLALIDHHRVSSADSSDQISVLLTSIVGRHEYTWSGHISRIEGAIDDASRQLHVIVAVDDSAAQQDSDFNLKVGAFVKAEISGKPLDSVYVIPRESISQKNEIALKIDGKLQKRSVTPIWLDDENVVVESGIEPGDELVLTPVSNLASGTPVATSTELAAALSEKERSKKGKPEKGKLGKENKALGSQSQKPAHVKSNNAPTRGGN